MIFDRKNARDYCISCAVIIKKEGHKRRNDEYHQRLGGRYSKQYKTGKSLNAEAVATFDEFFQDNCKKHGIVVNIPFTQDLSKNKIFVNKWGRITIQKARQEARNDIVKVIKNVKHTFFRGKVWLKILVEKSENRGDAINVLDTVADAVQDAIGVNDRWFSVDGIDWTIVKEKPIIRITITQDITEHHDICGCCGRTLPASAFPERVCKLINSGATAIAHKWCLECKRKDKPHALK